MIKKTIKTEQTFQEVVQEILNEVDYKNNPYFTNLENKSFNKEDFVETQKQFYYAVTFFSRPMGVLAAKIPTPQLRLEIVRNFWEEHGEGNFGMIHQTTFAELLKRLGDIELNEIEYTHLSPSVRIFNTVLGGTCTLEDYKIGVGMMGMIEHMFSDISGMIGRGIIDNKWLSEDNMIHYDVHEVLDIKHSKDFFDVIENNWKDNEHDRYLIKQGLELGAYVFNNLYRDLYDNREKRYEVSDYNV